MDICPPLCPPSCPPKLELELEQELELELELKLKLKLKIDNIIKYFNDYVKVLMDRNGYQKWKAEEEAKDIFDNYLYPFDEVTKSFIPNHMSKEKFNKYLQKMNDINGKYEKT